LGSNFVKQNNKAYLCEKIKKNMNFFKSFFASFLGSLVALGFILIFIFIGIAAIATATTIGSSATVHLEENSFVNLDLNKVINDRAPHLNPLGESLDLNPNVTGINQIIGSIKNAKSNPKIKGISLKAGFSSAGWAQAREIRKTLFDFKSSGKFIYAYADFLTQKGYYLSSVADSIFINPVGRMEIKGLSSEVLFYNKFQNEYGIKMEVIRHGKYKSAVEPFLQDKMSEENRIQIKSLITSIWETFREEVAESRNISPEKLDEIAENLLVNDANEALQNGIVDGIIHEDEYLNRIKDAITLDHSSEINSVDSDKLEGQITPYDKEVNDRIAILYAQGNIMYGEGSETVIGQKVFLEAIKEINENENIKGMVLRINSPGGDALTSEIILNSLKQLDSLKPMVVSMGNVAASGGYYIASNADKIFADPMTITGSIGVFAALPNLKGLADNLGINAEQVSTHGNAIGYSVFEPLQEGYRKTTKVAIEKIYEKFKSHVAEGRSMTLKQVEEIAQGRVWSGKEALEVGLVDSLGGLQAAIESAAALAEITTYNVVEFPKVEEDLGSMLSGVIPLIKTKIFYNPLEKFTSTYLDLNKLDGIQTRIPYHLKIE
jgi:protease-4